MDDAALAEVAHLARQLAEVFRTSMHWLDADDVHQDLMLAGFLALRRYDESHGVPRRMFVRQRMRFELIDIVRRASPYGRKHYASLEDAPFPVSLDAALAVANQDGDDLTLAGTISYVDPGFEEVEQRMVIADQRALLDRLLAEIPAEDAALLRVHYLDGTRQADIAARLGVTPPRVTQRMRKAELLARDVAEGRELPRRGRARKAA